MSRLSLLVDLSALLNREVDLQALLSSACTRLSEALEAERASIWLFDAERGDLVTRFALLPELPELRQPMSRGIVGHVATTGESLRLSDASGDPRFDPSADRETGFVTKNMLVLPIRESAQAPVRGVIQVLNHQDGHFNDEDERYLTALAGQLARALSLTTLRSENVAEPGLTFRGPFNHIVGKSAALSEVYERISLSAQTDATVMLLGETGTGKTLFARAVHVNSARGSGPFVTVDCTTLPEQLAESELFGHERGAFTGAHQKVPGKVELAHGGTLFLDEIGELPLSVQSKLLRFVQDHSFERVGGRSTQHSDVRVICATHRDLQAAVAAGTFRQDLYYRLMVVRIDVPPLRERGGDEIEILARHFSKLFAQRYRRTPLKLTPQVKQALNAHPWPGNVRELSNWVESAVVLSVGGEVRLDRLMPKPQPLKVEPQAIAIPKGMKLRQASQRYATLTLEDHDGNKTETAEALGISRNKLARLLNESND